MQEINWVTVIVALLSGGAMGAIISALVTSYRARVQPVGKRIDILPLFQSAGPDTSLQAKVVITSDGRTRTFQNLFVAEIVVVNCGNRDLGQFAFGVTFSDGDKCIHVDDSSLDRHHKVTQTIAASPLTPASEVDFVLEPFNRRDSYTLKLYIVVPEQNPSPGTISLGTSCPVRFVNMPTVGEQLARSLKDAVVRIGPLRIEL